MEHTTPEDEIALTEGRVRSLMRSVANLREQIDEIMANVAAGGDLNQSEVIGVLKQLNGAVVECSRTENKLDDCRNKQAGIARGSYALDLERARADIGCKLDKLRQCGIAADISE